MDCHLPCGVGGRGGGGSFKRGILGDQTEPVHIYMHWDNLIICCIPMAISSLNVNLVVQVDPHLMRDFEAESVIGHLLISPPLPTAEVQCT